MRTSITFIFLSILFSVVSYAQDWQEVMKVNALDSETNDYYGYSVDISGDYAIVGAYLDDPVDAPSFGSRRAGSAYILHNNNGTWEQVQKIWATDANKDDNFGVSVAISGDYAIVGAQTDQEDTLGLNPLSNAGSAYIFQNNSGVWEQVVKLVPETRNTWAYFGEHVAISGNYAIITADGMGDEAVYVFYNNSGKWQQKQRITDNHASETILSCAMNDSVFVLGHGSYSSYLAGLCSIYKNISGTWTFQQEIVPAVTSGTKSFGYAVDLSGDYLIVGAPYRYTPNKNGYAYIFQNVSGTWTEKQKITATDMIPSDYFGMSVAIEGKYAFVGSPYEDENQTDTDSIADAGSAYVFYNDNGNWIQKDKIVPSVRDDYGNFAETMVVDGGSAMIAGFRYDTNTGSVFCYEKLQTPEILEQPISVENICSGEDIQFAISASYVDGYQWQISIDTGKVFTDIIDDAIYSNSNTDSITLSGINSDMEGYQYRCVLTNVNGTTESNAAFFSLDTLSPVISSVHNDLVIIENGSCEAVLLDYTVGVEVTDNCNESLTIEQSPVAGTIVSGITNTISITASDDYGNSTTISFNVAVSDTISPVVSSIHNDTIISRDNNCVAMLPNFVEQIIATDNCDTDITITQSPEAGTVIFGSTNLITITAKDNFENETIITFNVAEIDDTPPHIWSTHADAELSCEGDGNAELPDYTTDVDANDYCTESSNLVITQSPEVGTSVSGSENAVILTVSDANGNEVSVSFNVAVIDSINPEISCVENQNKIAGDDNKYLVNGSEFDPPTTSDNCGVASLINDFNNLSTLNGVEIPVGTTTIVWTITDAAGNQKTCSFDVIVDENETSITTLENDEVLIYPNPATGFIYVGSKQNKYKTIRISDLSGKQVFEKTNIKDGEMLDVSKFSRGIYLISLHTLNEVNTTKLIVQ